MIIADLEMGVWEFSPMNFVKNLTWCSCWKLDFFTSRKISEQNQFKFFVLVFPRMLFPRFFKIIIKNYFRFLTHFRWNIYLYEPPNQWNIKHTKCVFFLQMTVLEMLKWGIWKRHLKLAKLLRIDLWYPVSCAKVYMYIFFLYVSKWLMKNVGIARSEIKSWRPFLLS